jgi:hypothetical protein
LSTRGQKRRDVFRVKPDATLNPDNGNLSLSNQFSPERHAGSGSLRCLSHIPEFDHGLHHLYAWGLVRWSRRAHRWISRTSNSTRFPMRRGMISRIATRFSNVRTDIPNADAVARFETSNTSLMVTFLRGKFRVQAQCGARARRMQPRSKD